MAMASSNAKSIGTLRDDGELPLKIHELVSVPNIDAGVAREVALVRRIDWNIIPVIMVLYLFSFLDRVNIGNARLYGLEADLRMVGNQYQTAVSLLFVTYCLFEVPSNLLLKKFTPSRYIAGIAIMWGVIATLSGLTQSYAGLIACRLLLGVFEAGLFPGLVTYLTLFYNRKELALRVSYLFVSAAIAGAVGGLIAYGISYMDGAAGLRAWRWIFILEGIPSVIIGILCWLLLPNDPDTARFLSEDERQLMVARRVREKGQTADAQKFHWADVIEGVKDWKIYAFCISQFGLDTMLYGFSTFLPTIIKGLGTWNTPQSQALTVPCYALGAISYIAISWVSDRTQQRGLYTAIFAAVSIIGYGLLISNTSSAVHYTGCMLVAMGLYVCVGLPLAWVPSNSPRYGKRALATAMQVACGNTSGIMAPFLYPTSNSPRYVMGHAVTLSLVGLSGCICAGMSLYFRRVNKRRAAGKEDDLIERMSEAESEELGDRNPRFVYAV